MKIIQGGKIMEMKKILVAVDGSENSKRALIEAKEYGEVFGGDVTILSVVKPMVPGHYSYLKPPTPEDNKVLENASKFLLKESLQVFDDFKGDGIVEAKLRRGNPADEILREAEEEEYDLIIMGSRGLGVFSRSFLGSVSNKVLNHTETNILIVK